jgi:ribosomal protein L31E
VWLFELFIKRHIEMLIGWLIEPLNHSIFRRGMELINVRLIVRHLVRLIEQLLDCLIERVIERLIE